MKSFKIWGFITGLLFIIGVIFLIFAWKKNTSLKVEKSNRLLNVQESKEKVKDFENIQKEIDRLNLEAAQIREMVSDTEVNPLAFIKDISLLMKLLGIKNPEFVYGQNAEADNFKIQNSKNAPQQGNAADFSVAEEYALKKQLIQINFECKFSQAVDFLKEIFKLKKLVSVEKLKIERDLNSSPRQKVNITLTTYVF